MIDSSEARCYPGGVFLNASGCDEEIHAPLPALACARAPAALLFLAACTPPATAGVSPAATTFPAPTATPPAPTVTPTLAPAPTPTNVPAGWQVLATPHFSLAYPPGWTTQTSPQQDGSVLSMFSPPDAQPGGVQVLVQERVSSQGIETSYCTTGNGDNQPTTLAALPMAYNRSGEGLLNRIWNFANAQGTVYGLEADDLQFSSTTQA